MKTVKDKSAMRKARRTAVRKDDYMIGKKQRHKDDVLVEKADGMIGKLRHDDMLVEVLIRLPVKKLFQFMCVSKLWRSIIIQPWFRVDYLKHNPCGLLIRVDDYWRPSFWYSTLREAEAQAQPKDFFNSLTINDRVGSYSRPELTQTINGLFCLIFFGVPVSRLFLFSVWRGEIMKLPEPRFRSAPGYHFGFEPVEGVYKLLAMSEIPRPRPLSRLIDCHILTLNSSNRDILSWKKIPSQDVHWVPVAYTQSFCVNGCMFWLYHPFLISFDLKEEKFRSVHPPNLNSYHFKSSWITQFKGRLALFKWDSDVEELVLYTLDDKDGFAWTKHVTLLPSELQRKVRSDIFDDDQGFIWTKYVTCLPKDLRRRLMEFFLPIVVPVGNLPTGELLLANATSEDPFTTVYSYNHNNNSFQRLVVGKLPQSLLFRRHDFIGHVADIISCVEPNFSPADIF